MAFRPKGLSYRRIFNQLGLMQNLRVLVDAGDAASYPGSGQTWKNVGNFGTDDFFLGTTSGVDASDPTFNGSGGNLSGSEYFSSPGGASFFTLASGANSAWMDTLHKDSANWATVAWYYPASTGLTHRMGGTSDTAGTNVGVTINLRLDETLRFNVSAALGSLVFALQITTVAKAQIGAWNFVGVAVDEAASTVTMQVNGVQETFAGAYTTPSAAPATSVMQIGAAGGGTGPMPAGDRIGMSAWWQPGITPAQMMSLYQFPPLVVTQGQSFRYQNRAVGY